MTKSLKFYVLACFLIFVTLMPDAFAEDFVWTGKAYIPVPAQLGADVILTMPEPFTYNFQTPSANEVSLWDENSILIRAKVNEQEQRLYIRGEKTGKTYLAKVSSRVKFQPLIKVIDGTEAAQEARIAQHGVTMTSLMRAMMLTNGIPPQGFQSQLSNKILLDSPPFKVTASEVWSSPTMTGIIATITSTVPNAVIPIVPTNIQILIPEYGALRMMGADFWEVSPAYPAARVYFVYAR